MNKSITVGAGASASGAGGAGGGGGGGGGGGAADPGSSGPQGAAGGGGSGGGGDGSGSSATAPSAGDSNQPSDTERALAREPNADPDDGRNQERRDARRKVAENFYEEGYPTRDADWRNSHLNGIDYDQPVEATTVPPPARMDQHMWPGDNPQPGNYFAPEGTSASELGINPNAMNKDSGNVEPRPLGSFDSPSGGTPALRTTAAPITDTWSDPDHPYDAGGGGTQYNIPDKGAMTPAS
jgi:hypothetical protein